VTGRRWLLMGIVGTAVVECFIWFFAASILWSTHDLLVGAGSSQAADNANTAVAAYVAMGINVIALPAFLVLRRRWVWWLLAGIQAGDLVVSLAAGFWRSPTWWLISGVAGLTLAGLYLFRFGQVQPPAGP
jgi:hypothetical protein